MYVVINNVQKKCFIAPSPSLLYLTRFGEVWCNAETESPHLALNMSHRTYSSRQFEQKPLKSVKIRQVPQMQVQTTYTHCRLSLRPGEHKIFLESHSANQKLQLDFPVMIYGGQEWHEMRLWLGGRVLPTAVVWRCNHSTLVWKDTDECESGNILCSPGRSDCVCIDF